MRHRLMVRVRIDVSSAGGIWISGRPVVAVVAVVTASIIVFVTVLVGLRGAVEPWPWFLRRRVRIVEELLVRVECRLLLEIQHRLLVQVQLRRGQKRSPIAANVR